MFDDLETAHFWGLKPSEYFSSSQADKVFMKAYMTAKAEMANIEAAYNQKKAEKKG